VAGSVMRHSGRSVKLTVFRLISPEPRCRSTCFRPCFPILGSTVSSRRSEGESLAVIASMSARSLPVWGPITIDPEVQNRGIGTKLMQAVLDRARDRGAAGVRLVQAAFHNRSLSLYTSLGFDIREPLSCLQGRTVQRSVPGCEVRPAKSTDMDACNTLSIRVHGFDRGRDSSEAIEQGTAVVVEREGRITAYASCLAFFGHATAETNLDLQALIASADSFGGPGILVPSRSTSLLRWCLANGLRIVQPMTLMSQGLYMDPAGAWIPSILF
jgi:hypothetical protein